MLKVDQVTLVWIVLMIATIGSWSMGNLQSASSLDTGWVAIALLVVAFVKVHLILRHFMELNRSVVALRVASTMWVVASCVAVCSIVLWWR